MISKMIMLCHSYPFNMVIPGIIRLHAGTDATSILYSKYLSISIPNIPNELRLIMGYCILTALPFVVMHLTKPLKL